jgi:hypothetical protein
MKKLLSVVMFLLLVVPVFGAKIKGKGTPEQIPDSIAYRQLFLILTEDAEPTSHASIQAYCDFFLGLTQPEKEELLKLVDTFNRVEKGALSELSKPITDNRRADLTQIRKDVGTNLANSFSAKDKLDAGLDRVKRGTEIEEGDEI